MRPARVVFGFLLWSATVAAQQYVISTYAGGGSMPVPAVASDLFIGFGSGVAADAAGNVYFTSSTLENPCHPRVSLTFPRSPSKQATSPPQKPPRTHLPQLFCKNK